MIVQEKNKEKITITFSAKIGKEGFNRVKELVEFLEKKSMEPPKKVSQAAINELADEIDEAAWKKFKKDRNINDYHH